MREGSLPSSPGCETDVRPVLLAVDDNPSVLLFVEGVLSTLRQEPEIITAANGEEALSRANERNPHVIIMDWDMPVMDGLTAIRQLKASPTTMDIPIVMLTAGTGEIDELRQALDAGAIDFVKKPVGPIELLARVDSALRISLATRALRESNDRLSETNSDLRQALEEVKTLSSLLPICSYCREVRSDDGYWSDLESYLRARTDTRFSHGICPPCFEEHYPELAKKEA